MRGNLAKNIFYKSSLTIPLYPSHAYTFCKTSAWIFVVVVFVPEPISMFVQRELVGQQTGEGGAQDSSPDGGLRHSTGKKVNVVCGSIKAKKEQLILCKLTRTSANIKHITKKNHIREITLSEMLIERVCYLYTRASLAALVMEWSTSPPNLLLKWAAGLSPQNSL